MTKLIRLNEVCARTGYCRAWIYRLIGKGEFPQPIKIGPRSSAWVEKEVEDWIEARPRGCSKPPEKAVAAAAKTRDAKVA